MNTLSVVNHFNPIKMVLSLVLILFNFTTYSQINTAEYQLKKGQSILYFDSDWNIVPDKNKAEFYRIYTPGPDNSSIGVVLDYYKSGQIQNSIERAVFIDKYENDDWIFDGKSITYYETGEKESELNFINGKIEGLYKEYYQSGKLYSVVSYTNGLEQGEYNSFYESGSNYIKYNANNGLIEGNWFAYYESGALKQSVEYVKGKKQGLLKNYNISGKLNFVIKFENGLKVFEESFYDSGETKYTWNYLNGKVNGNCFTFFRNGEEAEIMTYDNGKLINTHVKDRFGNTIYKSNGVNEDVSLYTSYRGEVEVEDIDSADNAILFMFEGEPFNSPVNVIAVTVEDGIPQYMNWEARKIQDEQGDVVFDGMYRSYYDNGQIERQANYSNDKLNGEEILYDRLGNILDTKVWINGVKNNWSFDCSNTPCEYFFRSDFTDQVDAESQGWKFYDDEDERSFVASSPEEARGTLYWENKDSKGRVKGISLPIDDTQDFQITATVDYWNGDDNNPFGIITGFKDFDNYVGLKLTANGFYKAQVVIKGVDVGMQEFKEVDDYYYEPTTLNIVRVNGQFFFSIDKKLVYTSEYTSLSGDLSGIYNSGVKAVTYDDFKVVKTSPNNLTIPNNKSYSNDDWIGNGSGIIFSNNGLIATNYHVIEGANSMEVEFLYNGQVESFSASVVRTDEVNDLAILKIDDSSFESMNGIRYNFKTKTSEVGESVFALGYPKALSSMGKDIKFTDGKISAKTGFQGDVTTYQTTTPIQPGNSGGPLFDYEGNLIGINSSKIVSDDVDNVAYTIKLIYLLTLIDSLNEDVDLPSNTSLQTLPLTSKITELTKYVTLIKVR
jgi:antitoxin component YwqK of YwqJK toxin-antitoxin module/S1-C subfamily serine protease